MRSTLLLRVVQTAFPVQLAPSGAALGKGEPAMSGEREQHLGLGF